MDAISSIPRIEPKLFEKVITQHKNELNTIEQLTELTRKQLAIAEKLRSLVA
jgi:hypothetical protein